MSGSDTRRAAVRESVVDGSELLRATFRRSAAGVAVITARVDGRLAGFTATSVASVAAEPPMLSFNIGARSSSWPVFARAEHVGVHILGEHQEDVAATFARSGADRFAEPTRWRPGPFDVPVLESVPAWVVCRVSARVPAGDHRVVLAQVLTGDPGGPGRPLLYHERSFTALRD
ncbi:flavin reductase family protein [Streptomyces alkaliterrae]|uniref:flavin reductase family protein n=1 Tax=Streptomyces alkaliterrae TaxID=2213162 RepID=UPI002B20B1FE|nr:flavin reductase family protein [Streptomyces alkaliterrae]